MALRKQLALTLSSLALGALLIGGGTFAYFSDTVTSANNTFATGTLRFGEATVLTAKTSINHKPGDVDTYTYNLVNGGTLDMGNVYFGMAYNAPDVNNDNGGLDLGTQLKVTTVTFGGQSVTIPPAAYNGDSTLTLSELKTYSAANPLGINLGTVAVGGNKDVAITIEFMETNTAQNQYQGETATMSFSFEARQ